MTLQRPCAPAPGESMAGWVGVAVWGESMAGWAGAAAP